MTVIHIAPLPGGRHAVRSAYDPTVIATIKAVVPPFARSWDAPRRRWTVAPDWAALLAAALVAAGHQVVAAPASDPPRQCSSGDWARHLLRAVGPSRVAVVHRALTRVLHPDNTATGCPVLQRELNCARDELEVHR
ncbi:hypothetical protein H7H78_17210 [Mycobacterium shinjukuense]|uniref:Uncharacterized protein n=1 Tax=Mycobacterium shinjukuense TaxID=398694 RepID=A0A7I7MP79_9MYCO|nr:hypothetical protein [Mycobacterium shinjukuense]MCV6987087.1 hypothetical protein [Mycobacterium shinjukuense]ORB61638.1 hypothetical protein BST45_19765 [Mycobacterium shinjukuense]BBX73916.1 hypothetical protein MSHI_18220 [Mycobacterium shinjukuense]